MHCSRRSYLSSKCKYTVPRLTFAPSAIWLIVMLSNSFSDISLIKASIIACLDFGNSILGFVPLAATAIYSATKAALHTYTLSQRYMLKDTSVKVIEIVPPWVQSNNDEPRAMPLSFIDATLKLLATDIDEVLVKEAEVFRNNPGPNEGVFLAQLNDAMQSEPPKIH